MYINLSLYYYNVIIILYTFEDLSSHKNTNLEENGGVSVAKAEVFRWNSVDVVEGVKYFKV